jgi:hypothetical protein
MKTATIYLWKEWHEQRATIAVLALVLLGAIGAIAALIPREFVRDPLVLQWAVVFIVIATVMSIGSDLFARERQQGALAFLERVPRGLESAFRGKLLFFAIALFVVLAYGGTLICCAVLARTGEWPRGLFDVALPWIPIVAIGTSLWVLVLSACMPSSALTLPATVLFVAIFAWPALLAVCGVELFRPTWTESVIFFASCAMGAPFSAWASFVIGSRRGRSRARAALVGAGVALPFFLPAWIWAGMRYIEVEHAPFEVLCAWIGPNVRYAFLDVARREPRGATVADSSWFHRCTAVTVDLERGEWRFPGEFDSSAFLDSQDHYRRERLLGSSPRRYLALEQGPQLSELRAIVDTSTARELPPDDARFGAVDGPSPADFGLTVEPPTYSIRWAGLGQVISFPLPGGEGRREIFRDPARDLVVEQARILPHQLQGYASDVRVRKGRWLARDGLAWIFVDPSSGAAEPATCIAKKEQLGPSVDDGRVVLMARDGICLLDPDTGSREPIRIVGCMSSVHWIDPCNGWTPPISLDSPTVVIAAELRRHGIGVLDLCARELRIVAEIPSEWIRLLATTPNQAITLEGGDTIARYSLEGGQREVLFSVADVRGLNRRAR